MHRRDDAEPRGATVRDDRRRSRSSVTGWASGLALVGIVAGLTFATHAHELPLMAFVATARKIASGQVWLLPASALIVDKPLLIGLAAFATLAVATLRYCGPRTFWLAAAAGHAGSTLLVYAIIGATRLVDPHIFTRAVGSPDFGVSAMQGAWVGAIAATAWRWAGGNRRNRALVAAGVCTVAGIGWRLHPDPSILTTEHVFAFFIGYGIASWPRLAAATASESRRLVSDRRNEAQHA